MNDPTPHLDPEQRARLRAQSQERAAEDLSQAAEAQLVERILAHTTRAGDRRPYRQDPRTEEQVAYEPAGPWTLREQLAHSKALRLVAASLLLHLLALPPLAWLALREPEPSGPRITFELPAQDADPEEGPGGESGGEPELQLPEPTALDSEEPAGPTRAAIENALRRDRYLLQNHLPSGAGAPPDGAALEIRLFAARTAGTELGEGSWTESDEAWRNASDAARILWSEVLLDRYARTRNGGAGLSILLARVAPLPTGSAPEAVRRAAAGTLQRAQAYGLWEAPTDFDPLQTQAVLDPARLRPLLELIPDADRSAATLAPWIRLAEDG